MAAGPGLGLLNRLITENGSPSALIEMGIGDDSFIDEEQKVFRMIREHYATHGVLPHVRTIEEETEVRMHGFPDEPLTYWVDKVKRRNKRRLIIDRSEAARKCAQEDDLTRAREEIQECLLRLEAISPISSVKVIGKVARDVITAHDERQRSSKLSGVPFGIEYIDMVTDGAQGGDSVAIVARPGMGKTYLLLKGALSAWLMGERPLFHSMEMGSVQIVRRLLALRTHIPAMNIRVGRLSYFARKKLITDIAELEQFESDHPFFLMQGDLTSTIEDLILRAKELKPTVIYVDGAYLLKTHVRTTARWDRVTETAEILKRIAVDMNIPSIATYQFNRRGPGSLGNIGLSDSIGQLASIVMGLADEQGGDREAEFTTRSFKTLHLIKGREGERGTVRMLFDMDRMQIVQDSVLQGYDEWEM